MADAVPLTVAQVLEALAECDPDTVVYVDGAPVTSWATSIHTARLYTND